MTQFELKTHHSFQWVVLLSERSWFPVLRGIQTGGILSVEQMQLYVQLVLKVGLICIAVMVMYKLHTYWRFML